MTPADDILLRLLAAEHLACPVCGYDLHRLTAPRCTECGKSLALKIVLANSPLRRAWIVALAAACLHSSLGLLSLTILCFSDNGSHARGEMFPPGHFFDATYFLQFALIFAPLPLLLARRHYQRLPPSLQTTLAIALAAWGLFVFITMARHLH